MRPVEGATIWVPQILSVDEMGLGIKAIRPKSIVDMMKVLLAPPNHKWLQCWLCGSLDIICYSASCRACFRALPACLGPATGMHTGHADCVHGCGGQMCLRCCLGTGRCRPGRGRRV